MTCKYGARASSCAPEDVGSSGPSETPGLRYPGQGPALQVISTLHRVPLALLAAATCLAPTLTFSKSVLDITPPEPLPLGGYTERSGQLADRGGDPLFVRTILLRQGNKKVAVVTAEMLTVPESLVREVRKRIPKDVFLFLAATHTHSAPDSQMLNERMDFAVPGIAKFNSKWLQWYADKISAGVNEAVKGKAQLVDWNVLQARVDLNVGRRIGALPDKTMTALAEPSRRSSVILRSPGEVVRYEIPQPQLVHYAAHGTVWDAKHNTLSGDWPGLVSATTNALVLQGPIGDVLPNVPAEGGHTGLSYFLQRTASALSFAKPAFEVGSEAKLAFLSKRVALGPPAPHPEFATSYKVPKQFAETIVKRFAPAEAEITAVRLGKLALVGIPGEPTSHVGREIRDAGRNLGFSSVLVVSHVNGWMGYILGPEDYDRGGYVATLSFYGREQGRTVVETAIEALRELRAR
jgi:neutral ceramidase